jgi:2-phospho-L-lactate guanylyltransferase (CobY/MobA/RfbA family)
VDDASEAKDLNLAATLLRVLADVVRKYSLNLFAEPPDAALAAAADRRLVAETALVRAVSWEPEQDTMRVRFSRGGTSMLTAFGTAAAMVSSMLKSKVLVWNS